MTRDDADNLTVMGIILAVAVVGVMALLVAGCGGKLSRPVTTPPAEHPVDEECPGGMCEVPMGR